MIENSNLLKELTDISGYFFSYILLTKVLTCKSNNSSTFNVIEPLTFFLPFLLTLLNNCVMTLHLSASIPNLF